MGALSVLVLCGALAPRPAPASAGAAPVVRPPVAVRAGGASEPPPSTYDLQRVDAGPAPVEGRGLGGQIWRTLVSLLLVLALIYALGRLALWRLGRGRSPPGKGLRVVERLALDARHALLLVEVRDEQRYLLATGGSAGVRLIAELAPRVRTTAGSFGAVLAAAAGAPSGAGDAGENAS